MMYPLRVSGWLQRLYPSFTWSVSADFKNRYKPVYLTFDDGPHPEITLQVMAWLRQYNAPSTFFCVGDNVLKYPDVYKALLAEGHQTGNHTQHHLSGWNTSKEAYIQDVAICASHVKSGLFRPPYGKITPAQTHQLKREYTLVMWSLLSGDFSPQLNTRNAFKKLINKTLPGDIVVFHDSLKAQKNLYALLPLYLDYLISEGYTPLPLQV